MLRLSPCKHEQENSYVLHTETRGLLTYRYYTDDSLAYD